MPLLIPIALALLAAITAAAGWLGVVFSLAKLLLVALTAAFRDYPQIALALTATVVLCNLWFARARSRRHLTTQQPHSPNLRKIPTADLYAELTRRELAEYEREMRAWRRSRWTPWSKKSEPPSRRPSLPEVKGP